MLDGSLQISGHRGGLTRTIDTRTGTQIWAEQDDRKLEDIFALQSELAQTIAGQLKATLSTGEKEEIWKQPTQDLQAYDFTSRASRLACWKWDYPGENWNVAIDLLNRAITRDPKFTLAYCVPNEAYVLQDRYGEDHSPSISLLQKMRLRQRCGSSPSRRAAPCFCPILLSWVG